jgi:hypothetical protein
MQDDDGSIPISEAAHDTVDQRPVGDLVGLIGQGRFDDLDDAYLHGPSSPTAHQVETGIDGQSIDPGVEPIGIAQAPKVAPGPEETLLNGIARELTVAEDQPSGRVQPRDTPVNELGEGVMIAVSRPLDEPSLVHGPPRRRRSPCGLVCSLDVPLGRTVR